MRTMKVSLFSAALLIIFAINCGKKDTTKNTSGIKAEETSTKKDTGKTDTTKDEKVTPPSSTDNSSGDNVVGPPVAADLKKYTADLKGNGPLHAAIETTLGTFHCVLYGDKTPMTVANFVGLARGKKPFTNPRTRQTEVRPFYDGIVFHRVIPNFMIQTGDPLGRGTGGPGYRFGDEFDSSLKHDSAGILSMANAGPGTNGSQFFITERPTPHLDGKHTVFGKCKEVDLVKKIARYPRANGKVSIKKITFTRGK